MVSRTSIDGGDFQDGIDGGAHHSEPSHAQDHHQQASAAPEGGTTSSQPQPILLGEGSVGRHAFQHSKSEPQLSDPRHRGKKVGADGGVSPVTEVSLRHEALKRKRWHSQKVTQEELRSVADLKITLAMPIDDNGHHHIVLKVSHCKHGRVYLSVGVRIRNLLFWLVLLISMCSASALQVGSAFLRPAMSVALPSVPQPVVSRTAEQHSSHEATQLPYLLEAIAGAGVSSPAAAAALFTEQVEYEDMLLGVRAVGLEQVIAALRHQPHALSTSLPRQLLGMELPQLRLVVQSTAQVDDEAVVEWQAHFGGMALPLGRGLTKLQLCPHSRKVCRWVDVAEVPWRAAGSAMASVTEWVQSVGDAHYRLAQRVTRLAPGGDGSGDADDDAAGGSDDSDDSGGREERVGARTHPAVAAASAAGAAKGTDPVDMWPAHVTVRGPMLIDTDGDGVADAMLLDSDQVCTVRSNRRDGARRAE